MVNDTANGRIHYITLIVAHEGIVVYSCNSFLVAVPMAAKDLNIISPIVGGLYPQTATSMDAELHWSSDSDFF